MHDITKSDKPWIPCTCIADTPNVNLHSNIQWTQWQMEPDLPAARETVQDNPESALATLIKIPVPGPRAGAAATIINTPAPVGLGLTPMTMVDICTEPVEMMVVMRAGNASRRLIAMMMMMNCDPHVKDPTYYRTGVTLPV
jgi:hypothetical protein